MSLRITREECIYTNSYWQENVWHLCNYFRGNHPALLHECYAVFISNENQTVPLWSQKNSSNHQGLVVWDYHVIFIHYVNTKCDVYDLDTTLAFPCSFDEYRTSALGSDETLQTQFRRSFRVIPADQYLASFASDRTHMIKDGEWLKPPPVYPPIYNTTSRNNLYAFINMTNTSDQEVPGQILNHQNFILRFS
ncbi:protein N-terminal glutamine amidohydrolase-like [Daphnia carinata]|uniref:protein N-terminal glutamine amidohydrolase-like n=1 Tax=Daphnia carinata TaxID=120202 RepID=UPI00286903B9|nr:protein N-terminal glutamine amidohydrolase-like [Daphnia carinata]